MRYCGNANAVMTNGNDLRSHFHIHFLISTFTLPTLTKLSNLLPVFSSSQKLVNGNEQYHQ